MTERSIPGGKAVGRLDTKQIFVERKVKVIYNEQKGRVEWWTKMLKGDGVWALVDTKPARVWNDSFVSPAGFLSTIIGYSSDLQWGVNGVRATSAPNANNFAPANDIGGGVIMRALSGNDNDDYTAIHLGDNYPTKVEYSPHLKIHVNLDNTDDVGYVGGLADDTRATGTNAFTPQDNFIGITYDTDVDKNMYFKITVDGSEVVSENLGSIPDKPSSVIYRVNDDGDAVTFILNGSIVGTYQVTLPTVQLQPYMMVMTRDSTAGDKDVHLHDFRLIMDRGGCGSA